jgi:tetratricopeptide (TPR) repeat protein
MARDRQADLATLQAVQAAAQGGDFARAAALARPALDGGLQHPLLFNVVALELERSGRVDDAAGLLAQGVALHARDAALRNALGLCLLRLDRPAEALAQFEALLALDASLAYAHAGQGAAHLAAGSIDAASASYRKALELDPRQGVAMAGLAHIAVRRGNFVEARDWASKALTVLPNFPDAVMSLAAAEAGEGSPAKAEARLRALLSDARLEPLDRAYANGLLGDALDAGGRPEEAFKAYSACNDGLRKIHAGRFGAGPGALSHVRDMLGYFARARGEDWKKVERAGASVSGAQGHVFLLGFPRSGTTLLEVILEGHPDVASLEENESLIRGVREYMRGPEGFERLSRATARELQPLRDDYWRHVADREVAVAGKVFVDKHPLNTLKLPLIAKLFPDARILFACRDPRDVVLSCFRRRFRMSAPLYELLTLEGGARFYDAVMQLRERLAGVLALDMRLVRHEDLVTDFSGEIARICAFLGLREVAAMSDFAERARGRAELTPSTAQLTRGLNREGIGGWRRYRSQLAPALPLLHPWVTRFGYDAA